MLDRRQLNGFALSAGLAAAGLGPRSGMAEPVDEAANLKDFDFMVEKITKNYAGFSTKVTTSNRPQLDALTKRLREKARTASDAELADIAKQWTNFFRDGHTQARFRSSSAARPASGAPALPKRNLSEAETKARLQALGADRRPIEAIWNIDNGRYRLAVLRRDKSASAFEAVVLTTTSEGWSPGEIKAVLRPDGVRTFKADYISGDHGHNEVQAELLSDGEALTVHEWGQWLREWPAVSDPARLARRFPQGLFMQPLSERTLWLRIPDFGTERAKPLIALLAENAAHLEKSPNLVIDLRGNTGGSDFVYEPLTPLLYTRPIYTIDVERLATADNLALWRENAKRLRADLPDAATEFEAMISVLERHVGEFAHADHKPFGINRMEKVATSPRRVAVLIDNAASTGEQFILEARQSHKVTLFGQRNSAGVLDFANVVHMDSPSGRIALQWATSRSMRLPDDPVDPDGIAPDIRIPESETDPVGFAQAWLERQAD